MMRNIGRYQIAVIGLFFIAASPPSCSAPKNMAAHPNAIAPTDWEALMIKVNAASDDIEKGIHKKGAKEEVIQSIEQMKTAFGQLRNMKPPKGSSDLFRQYVEAGSGILRDVEDHVEHSYWEKAQGSFARIKDLQRDIEKDFAPGLWSRVKLWNAR